MEFMRMGGDNTLNDFRHIPRKRFGQHWLKDQGVLDQIVKAAELNPEDCVLEVGPGKVLSGLIKRIDRNVILNQVNNLEDVKNIIND